ncbi:hypothetical protein RFI_05237 [Reticulomyxa filosa]|uniref:SAP domain-containing protein n=1 Tax=Reticulomyxa filosa TaxID=46433 RepID=X6P197_RETFI|nr:hypothetical protein RFI_05237 [Reticulomyxa filosa]|eukprot:ETO31878.1 hypothetical protein RFI_05237 [Reticulomyxa filosa]
METRKGRRENKYFFCVVVEKKKTTEKYGLKSDGNRKLLQNRVRDELLQNNPPAVRFRDCFTLCENALPSEWTAKPRQLATINANKSLRRRRTNAHDRGFCGCFTYRKPCTNPNGQYICKAPHYSKHIIEEWAQEYSNAFSCENDQIDITSGDNPLGKEKGENEMTKTYTNIFPETFQQKDYLVTNLQTNENK